ncbi:MAG: Ig domain-containing protein [Pirellulaceae bacterium]
MNSRERILAIAVGSAVALGAVFWLYTSIAAMYASRSKELETLETAVTQQRNLDRQIMAAAGRMRNYEEKSLPRSSSVARSVYQTWLLELFGKSGMGQPQVTIGKGKEEKKLYSSLKITMHSQGTLPQVVKFLHGYYSADYMHRISKLHLKPIKESKNLDVIVDFEAMSLERAPDGNLLNERLADRLELAKQEDYVRIISERNLFGSPNRAPQIAGLGSQKATRGKSVDIAARGSDPDRFDKLTYKLVKSGAADARLDSSTGKLAWTPRTNGKYEFLMRATDDGWPAKESKDELLIVTVEDPPPPPAEPPKKLAFDEAKHTVLTGVIDVNGTGQIWLSNRPKGETLKLGVGDKFEVGSIKGIVTSIGDGDFTFETDGKERKVLKGSNLGEATTVPQ